MIINNKVLHFALQQDTTKKYDASALCFSCNEFVGGFAFHKENN